jgi:hypothetical protein
MPSLIETGEKCVIVVPTARKNNEIGPFDAPNKNG